MFSHDKSNQHMTSREALIQLKLDGFRKLAFL